MPRSIAPVFLLALLVLLPPPAFARNRHQDVEEPPAPPAAAMVSLTPGPGIAFQIPEDWIACEDDVAKLLHSGSDPQNLKTKFCAASLNVPSKLRAFDPRPLHMLGVIFNYHANQPITEPAMNAIAPADLARIQQALCDVETKPLAQSGIATTSCDVVLGTLAGHRALVSTLIETPPDSPNYRTIIVSYEVAYPQGYMQIQFSHPEALDKIVKPLLDAIVASIQISSAASPPPASDAPQAPQEDSPQATPPAPAPQAAPGNSI